MSLASFLTDARRGLVRRTANPSRPAGEPPVQRFFQRPVRPFSFPGQGETPLWAADGYDPDNLVGISERFLENADVYTETYTHSENILDLLRRAMRLNGLPIEEASTALDFGSGPGTNTVFPLHLINPDLHIVATDISPNLLATLSRLADSYPLRERLDIVCWDCGAGGIAPDSFDLVTGVSLLHHLLDPRLALKSAYEALRPGGWAFFVDPFDGAGLIRGLYQILLAADVGHNERLADSTVAALKTLSRDYEARMAGSEPEHFTELEDKWIFSPEWIQDEGRAAGFAEVIVRNNWKHETMYGDYLRIQLRMQAGAEAQELPGWALTMLSEFDASFTPAMRRRMILEGTILMRK
jgi:SAM-dependent methyltransferase